MKYKILVYVCTYKGLFYFGNKTNCHSRNVSKTVNRFKVNPEFLSQVSVNFNSREKDWKAIKGLVLQNRLNKKYSFDILQLVLLKNARLRKSKLQNAKISI